MELSKDRIYYALETAYFQFWWLIKFFKDHIFYHIFFPIGVKTVYFKLIFLQKMGPYNFSFGPYISARTVYFWPKTVYFPPGPYIFKDRIFYVSVPYILLSNHFIVYDIRYIIYRISHITFYDELMMNFPTSVTTFQVHSNFPTSRSFQLPFPTTRISKRTDFLTSFFGEYVRKKYCVRFRFFSEANSTSPIWKFNV